MNCNNISSFENMIKLALDKLYNDDSYLFNIDTSSKIKKHVGERAIVFRFGLYFQQELDKYEFFNDFKLDCEYNRSGSNPKQLQIIGNRFFPDLILHKRGDNKNNLLVIEFKGWWNKNQIYDEKKIKEMVKEDGEFRYCEGYTILLEKNREQVKLKPLHSKDKNFRFNIKQ